MTTVTSTVTSTVSSTVTSTVTAREQREIDAANAFGKQPVVFIHGLWLLAGAWDPWRAYFEERGFASMWTANVFGLDAVGALGIVGRETRRIELGTAVVPIQPRHPVALAQQALTAQAGARGRFVLGVGLSHKIVIENMLGLSYAKPARDMREYLSVLVPLLGKQPVSFQGERPSLHCASRPRITSPWP